MPKKSYKDEVIVKEFKKLTENEMEQTRVRVVKNGHGVALDIRRYVTTERYTGWTPKGIRLNWDAVLMLQKELDGIVEAMDGVA